ncbi:MAG: hypothetical protein U0401_28710 [Anaerolineae bacterium]
MIVFLARLFNDIGVRMIHAITQLPAANLSVVDFGWLVFGGASLG